MTVLEKKTLDGNIDTLLLAALQESPSYGYELIQTLNARAAGLLRMGEGTAYPVLHRLERRGLICSRWTTAESGRRRKYYRLTARGKKSLASNTRQWQALTRLMRTILGPVESDIRIIEVNLKGLAV
jgi:PadR family transcriptional regulator PadR